MRRRQQQIAKFAERVRPDRIAVVGSRQPAVGALGGENIEMVVPEIHHQLVELPLAVHGAQQPRLLQLEDNEPRRLHFAGHGAALFGDFRRRIEIEEFAGIEPHGFQPGGFLFYGAVRDFIGIKLFVEIGTQSESVDILNRFPRRSKTRAI